MSLSGSISARVLFRAFAFDDFFSLFGVVCFAFLLPSSSTSMVLLLPAKRLASAAVSSQVSLKEKRDLPFPHLESLLLQQQRHHQTSFVPAGFHSFRRWRRWHSFVRIRLGLAPSSSASEAVPPLPCPIFLNLQEIFLRVRADLNDRFRFHVFFNLLPVSLVSVSSRKEDE